MRVRVLITGVLLTLLGSAGAGTAALLLRPVAGDSMSRWGEAWVASLDESQRKLAVMEYGDDKRLGWHFIPKNDRKGLQLKDMNPAQRANALRLLRAALSEAGFDKSTKIMELDEILRLQEGANAKNIRDPNRYYFTVFGKPATTGKWGLSVEGHHLSLNFVVKDGQIVDSTPQFMGANPAEVKKQLPGLPNVGFRVLRDEEQLGFDLLKAIGSNARDQVMIAAEAPADIRAAGEPQPPTEKPAGVAYGDMTEKAKKTLVSLVETYCASMPEEVAAERLKLIEKEKWDGVHFAWAGADRPGVGHYYRIQGPTFLIEFINVQNDAEGNPANHIHSVWRDLTGDFDLPVK